MYKEIVILAKSNKRDMYCIAGIDIETGEWIRPISSNETLEGAVPPKDIKYSDSEEVEILDVVGITFKEHRPINGQPENYLYDSSQPWSFIRRMSLAELLQVRDYDNVDFIFYNQDKEVRPEEIVENGPSLLILKVSNARIYNKTFNGRTQVQLMFTYRGREYSFFKISDRGIKSEYIEYDDGFHSSWNELTVVFSLTGCFHHTNKHYKMVAKMFV